MFVAPMPIGPFLIEETGHLTLRMPEPAPGFAFSWRGTGFTVKLTEGTLLLRAQAGRVPSTAEGKSRREDALVLLRAVPAILPAGLRLRLLPDHRIQIETEDSLSWPTTASGMLTPIVAMMMRLAPVLDLFEEAGLHIR